MTDDSDGPMWPPEMFKLFTETGEQAVETQQELFRCSTRTCPAAWTWASSGR